MSKYPPYGKLVRACREEPQWAANRLQVEYALVERAVMTAAIKGLRSPAEGLDADAAIQKSFQRTFAIGSRGAANLMKRFADVISDIKKDEQRKKEAMI